MNQQITQFNLTGDTNDIVIFVHGFGVRWDSRGMFTYIQKSLPSSWGSVLFDFYNISDKHITITPIKEQIGRLQSIIQQTKERCPGARLHIVAHSKGCIITALTQPTITGKIILLSPPESFSTKLEKYFKRYPGATQKDNELIIPRKDGTITHIPLSFFPETQRVDAEQAILELSKKHLVNLLQTTEDEVIGKTEYKLLLNNPNIDFQELASDHNFTDKHRDSLIEYIRHILSGTSNPQTTEIY